jgi:hypothetical protein
MRFFFILALATFALADGPANPVPATPATPDPAPATPAPAYPAPDTPAPAYGGGDNAGYGGGDHHEGYGDEYGAHKFYAPSLGDRLRAKFHRLGERIEHGAHRVGAYFKDKWLTFKSDLERIAYWGHCKTDKFRKYWKLKWEYEQGKRRELSRLEREKLEFFRKWCAEHRHEYERRKSECGNKNDYNYDMDPKNAPK